MGALDPAKILVVLVIALIVLGPEKLPRVARQLGAAWRELTKFREKVEAEVRGAMPDLDLPRLPTRPGAAVAGFLADLTSGTASSTGSSGSATGTETTATGAPAPAGAPVRPAPAPSPPLERGKGLVAVDDPSMN